MPPATASPRVRDEEVAGSNPVTPTTKRPWSPARARPTTKPSGNNGEGRQATISVERSVVLQSTAPRGGELSSPEDWPGRGSTSRWSTLRTTNGPSDRGGCSGQPSAAPAATYPRIRTGPRRAPACASWTSRCPPSSHTPQLWTPLWKPRACCSSGSGLTGPGRGDQRVPANRLSRI
jgi:hypothetical protein